jgi:hypothetical protein
MQNQAAMLRATLGYKTAALLSGGSAGANVGIINLLPDAQRVIAREAFRVSLKKMWIVFACVCALGLIASIFVGKHTLSKENLQMKTGLPQYNGDGEKDGEKDGNHNPMPATTGNSKGTVIDKV